MYTEPKISKVESVNQRCFVYFYYNSKRYKFYNGKQLNLNINPNKCSDLAERERQLYKLALEFETALSKGWNPVDKPIENVEPPKIVNVEEALGEALNDKLKSPLSDTYKRDLRNIHSSFIGYLKGDELIQPIVNLPSNRIFDFLKQYNTSGTNYMNKRRTLGVLFAFIVNRGYLLKNPVLKTPRQKTKATLHDIYEQKQLKLVLTYLKDNYPNLYLCCLLAYGCFIRPHREFRLLKRQHFNDDLTEIHLSGFENKSGRVRVVYIPNYVQLELRQLGIHNLASDVNITSGLPYAFNESYFSLQWARAKHNLLKLNYINSKHTIYSFRHTAAVNVYKKTKDLHLLQQLLGHSNMIVTLKYLRGLGVHNMEELKHVMPTL